MHSFKLRGAGNAISMLSEDQLEEGVYSCSAGNFGQGLAYSAQQMGVPCTIIAPDSCPSTKLEAIKKFGGQVITVPYSTWWEVIQSHQYPGVKGHFIHPVCERSVVAGIAVSLFFLS